MFYFLNLQVIININEDPNDDWYHGFIHPVWRGTEALPWSPGMGFADMCLVAGSLPMESSQAQTERKIWFHPPSAHHLQQESKGYSAIWSW